MNNLSESFENCFKDLEAPRVRRTKLYPLSEILFIALLGTICGVESWRELVSFGKEKLEFLREYYPYKNGIPSKNTFFRVLASLSREGFKQCFTEWVNSLRISLDEVRAIDDKTLCNSFDKKSGKEAIHMLSAFATEARLVLAQEKVDEKSNEITAIPKVLSLLKLKAHTVTIDAMGTQKKIAKQIIEQEADYVLALKGNQDNLNDEVRTFFETEIKKTQESGITDCHEDLDKGDGRIKTRRCFTSDKIEWISQKEEWAGFKTIAMIEEIQESKNKNTSTEQRFFITSLPADAKRIAHAIGSHRLIENILHWTLDLVFNEELSPVRKDNDPENMALIRQFTLNMLNNVKKHFKDTGVKTLRKKATWGEQTLKFILKQSL